MDHCRAGRGGRNGDRLLVRQPRRQCSGHRPPAATASAPAATGAKAERKILYYLQSVWAGRHFAVPKKDSMGMDYIAVREGETKWRPGCRGEVRISTEKVQKLGVRTEPAALA